MQWGPRFALLVFVLPLPVCAQVVINEVMYNPEGSDSGREWVELYNEGQADVAMAGGSGKGSWRISDGSNHTLTDPAGGTGRGSLVIPAGGYLVVASDPGEFISGEYAGGSYAVVKSSISLNNSGGTVSLLDGSGATLDAVSYSPSQGGSDDGSSLQRQQDGSWIAAPPTPGAANANVPYVAPSAGDTSDQSQSNTAAGQPDSTTGRPQTPAPVDSYVPPPTPSLYADAGSDRTVIVGADVEFDASAYDKTQTPIDPSAVRFLWNFGDGGTAEGDSVLHHFSYPGRYAVVLEIAENKSAAAAQITVDAQPAALALSLLPDGGIGAENLAGRDLDLSGWIVRENAGSFAGQFMLPQESKLLARSSMQISPQTLSFRASSSTMLEYPNGTLALAMGERTATSAPQEVSGEQARNAAPVAAEAATGAAPILPKPASAAERPTASAVADAAPAVVNAGVGAADATSADPFGQTPEATATVLQTASVSSASSSKYLWWLGVFALAGSAAAAAAAAGFFKKGEWDVVEDTGP